MQTEGHKRLNLKSEMLGNIHKLRNPERGVGGHQKITEDYRWGLGGNQKIKDYGFFLID